MNNNILFWLDGPPVCCKGLFDAVAEKWPGDAYYVCTKKIGEDRVALVECEENQIPNNNRYIYLDSINDCPQMQQSFLEKHLDDIHVFNGYLSNSSRYMKMLLKMNKKANIVVWAERPGSTAFSENALKNGVYQQLLKMRHRWYAMQYRNCIAALLPLGEKGVNSYAALGWSRDRMFPILYLPEMHYEGGENAENNLQNIEKVKFVYLGRFSSAGKGTDLLLNACQQLRNDNYSLEMVGGYGDYREETLKYISENPHLSFGGTWKIAEACKKLQDYDICIVPSRYEGWNVTVNEAVMAGIGCIVTDEAVSDEMISESGAGIVTKPDSKSIAAAMDSIIEKPALVSEFKSRAVKYRERTTADICAKYFIDIMNYLFDKDCKCERPAPPWLSR